MKALLAAALAAVLAGPAGAQDKAGGKTADPTGTWKCETDIGGQKRASTLKLKLDGDKLTGSMVWPDGMESKIEDAKYKDGEATFTAAREREGQKFNIKYKAKVEGDTVKGTAEADFGGETRKFEFAGKREKKAD